MRALSSRHLLWKCPGQDCLQSYGRFLFWSGTGACDMLVGSHMKMVRRQLMVSSPSNEAGPQPVVGWFVVSLRCSAASDWFFRHLPKVFHRQWLVGSQSDEASLARHLVFLMKFRYYRGLKFGPLGFERSHWPAKKFPRICFKYSVSFSPAEYEYENHFFPARPVFLKSYVKSLKNTLNSCF